MELYLPLQFPSATGTGIIQGRLYKPAKNVEASGLIIQIVHGMAEHQQRYESFCLFLASHGHAVCIQDLPGHGRSVSSTEYLGYFGATDGTDLVIADIDRLADLAIQELSSQQGSVRRVILGHSMGSFISRLACTGSERSIAAAIFSGTSGNNPAAKLGILLAEISIKRNGPLYKDKFLARLSSVGNLKRIANPRTPIDWLSRDQKVVDAYLADPLCGFTFTAAGYRDLFCWLVAVSERKWPQQVKPGIPILLVSGSDDPIGQFGKGPRQICNRLKKAGHPVSLKLYEGARHEVLNETNRLEVWNDILSWLHDLGELS